MNLKGAFARKRAHKLALLSGTASLAALASVLSAQAQPTNTTNANVEEVLVTGSLIHGAAVVGVPVVALSPQDFKESGALTIGDFLRTVSAINVGLTQQASSPSGSAERGTFISLHGLGGTRSELMVDGMRYPLQSDGANQIDPSVLPELAIDRIDVLADGASATYGSDAIAGVVNVIMKRGFDGAVSQLRYGEAASSFGGGNDDWQASQLYGRKWDSGDVTLTYQNSGTTALDSTFDRLNYQATVDYTPWGLDNRTPLASSSPGVVSTGAPSATTGTTCTNCYSVPSGQNGVGLTWTALLANPGVKNEVNPYAKSSMSSPQRTNSATITFDQRLLDGISLFADAFYNNRRALYDLATNIGNGKNNEGTFTVPTANPFYPVGAPAGLRVSYNLANELNPRVSAGEIAKRWDGGFNLDLPYGWHGRIFTSLSENRTYLVATNLVNVTMLNAALGTTVAAIPANGAIPGVSAFTKPANVPYLNLFCDSSAFTCNSEATLNYISAFRIFETTNKVGQSGANFDGPLFDLPGGELRAAIGFDVTTYNYYNQDFENFNQPISAIPANIISVLGRQVPAAYAQVNIPVFSDANAIPLFKKLDFEVSYRYDHYSDFGGVTSPKVSFDWTLGAGVTLKGGYGTSFRAPFASELLASNAVISPVNLVAGGTSNNQPACATVGGTPVAGSAAAVLNPTCSAALQFQGGITINASVAGAAGIRPGDGAPAALGPEKSKNSSFGAEFAPDYIPGLDLQVTYFKVNISGFIFAPSIANGSSLNNPLFTFTFVTAADPNFSKYVAALISNPASSIPPNLASNITWISDGAYRNTGFFKVDGVDFQGSYDLDLGGLGALNVGVNGTYYTRNQTQNVAGGAISDKLAGNSIIPDLKYRARLGWTDGTFTVNTYVNYQSHYFTVQAFPPAALLANFPNYSDIEPAFTTIDLSLGYNTGDAPANYYLKGLDFELLVNDVFDKRTPFSYFIQTSGANPSANDPSSGDTNVGRYVTFMVTKTW